MKTSPDSGPAVLPWLYMSVAVTWVYSVGFIHCKGLKEKSNPWCLGNVRGEGGTPCPSWVSGFPPERDGINFP